MSLLSERQRWSMTRGSAWEFFEVPSCNVALLRRNFHTRSDAVDLSIYVVAILLHPISQLFDAPTCAHTYIYQQQEQCLTVTCVELLSRSRFRCS
eukprot:5244781-Amphidinium_carterae.1